ncbi:hypothetical protein C3L33_19300, partial [Rhododendron williamsianum]
MIRCAIDDHYLTFRDSSEEPKPDPVTSLALNTQSEEDTTNTSYVDVAVEEASITTDHQEQEDMEPVDANVQAPALDSHDVELVRMLIEEEHTSIDYACALHYAVAYCDAKIITRILDLAIAMEQPAALTSDGRKALNSKRLTRAADYYKSMSRKSISQGSAVHRDIGAAESRDPLLGEAEASLAKAEDDLRMGALYLEDRVALGKRFFPRCSEVINGIMDDDDLSELLYIQNGSQEERQLKKRRFMEIQEAFTKAFHEDKEELDKKSLNISSSSRPVRGVGRPNGKLPLKR